MSASQSRSTRRPEAAAHEVGSDRRLSWPGSCACRPLPRRETPSMRRPSALGARRACGSILTPCRRQARRGDAARRGAAAGRVGSADARQQALVARAARAERQTALQASSRARSHQSARQSREMAGVLSPRRSAGTSSALDRPPERRKPLPCSGSPSPLARRAFSRRRPAQLLALLAGQALSLPSSISAWRTQRRNDSGAMPSSRAVLLMPRVPEAVEAYGLLAKLGRVLDPSRSHCRLPSGRTSCAYSQGVNGRGSSRSPSSPR